MTLEAADLRVPVLDTDRDNDGHIEEKELSTVMRIMGMEPSDAQLRELIKSVDFDNNGKIEFEEFATLMARRMLVSDGDFELKQAFKLFDVDENGRLSVEEVRAMFMYDCGTDGLKLGDVDELVRLADPDGSGWVTVEEFVTCRAGRCLCVQRPRKWPAVNRFRSTRSNPLWLRSLESVGGQCKRLLQKSPLLFASILRHALMYGSPFTSYTYISGFFRAGHAAAAGPRTTPVLQPSLSHRPLNSNCPPASV